MTKVIGNYKFKFDYNKFVNDIEAFISAHELYQKELDELAGLGHGNVSNIINKRFTNNKIETILAIANAMDIDVRDYFVLDV